jgi:hypothetical protein
MGKTRGHGSRPKGYKGNRGKKTEEDGSSSSEEEFEQARGIGACVRRWS